MSGVHARLSASSAHRWTKCAGSVNQALGKRSVSEYMSQGTFAHEIAATCLNENMLPDAFWLQRKTIDGFEIECDTEMVEGVTVYLDAIKEDRQDGDIGVVEMPLLDALQTVDPDMGGTADYVRYRPGARSLRVFDFKYGSGTFVEADSNEQLMIYALGALIAVNMPIEEVEVTIVQPRYEGAAPVRTWKFKAAELLDFRADAQDAAARSREKNPALKAGNWCKFCPAIRTCPEAEKHHHAVIAAEFASVADYDPEKLAAALKSIPIAKGRIKALEEFAYAEALRGARIPGFKLVDKVARRKWRDETAVRAWGGLRGADVCAVPEVLSPAQLEARLAETIGKKAAVKELEPLWIKQSSGTVLVAEDDDRKPVAQISADDFQAQPAKLVNLF